MNGAGNDFILADNREGRLDLSREQIARICDRHRGVGADGLLLVEPGNNGVDFTMRYYNSDGGEVEMCGNGARCFARFVQRLTGVQENVSFTTVAGLIKAHFDGELVELAMSEPKELETNITLSDLPELHFVNTGVPHVVIEVDDPGNAPVIELGRRIRNHPRFEPPGTNVNFITCTPEGLAVRTYERGVEGETLACGTGVVAAAIIAAERGIATSPVRVQARSGDFLEVSFEKENGRFSNVKLKGPADFVFQGTIEI